MKIWTNSFEIRESVKVRQAQEMAKISKLYEEKLIDDIDMAVKTVAIMLLSINGWEVSEDWIKDNLDPSELWELSSIVMEKVNEFVKKNQNLSMNTKHIWTNEAEDSAKSGE